MIAGIDYSTLAIDVVLLDEDTDAATWHRYELTGNNAFDRARDVNRRMPSWAHTFWDDVLAVGIEDPRGYGAGALYRVQGAVLSMLPSDTLVQPWIPSAWRKTVGLPGNASKADVAAFVDLRSGTWDKGEDIWPQDACDAYCIALATRTALVRS